LRDPLSSQLAVCAGQASEILKQQLVGRERRRRAAWPAHSVIGGDPPKRRRVSGGFSATGASSHPHRGIRRPAAGALVPRSRVGWIPAFRAQRAADWGKFPTLHRMCSCCWR